MPADAHWRANYRVLLADIPSLVLPEEPAWARSNWQSYCVRLPAKCEQRVVMQRMLDVGIATRRGIMCAHREPAYRTESWRGQALPHSEEAQDHALLLPLYHQLTETDQARIAESLRLACRTD